MPSFIVYAIVYTLLLVGAISAKKYSIYYNKPSYSNNTIWICIGLVSVFVGLRWMVGGDYPNYLEVIKSGQNSYELDRFELIPRYIVIFINNFGWHFSLWFIMMELFQYVGILLITRRKFSFLLPWIMLLFLTSFFWQSLNIIRQVTAAIYVVVAYTYISEKNLKKFLLYVAIAVLFHTSAIIAIPLFWITDKSWINSRWIQYLVIFISATVGAELVEMLSSILLDSYSELMYISYLERDLEIEKGTGLGILLTYVRYSVLVYYSNILKKKYESYGFNVFYNLTFIDMCLYSSIATNQMISRIAMYFSVADIMASAFLLHYLTSKDKHPFKQISLVCVLGILIAISVYSAVNGKPWKFVIS